MMEMIAYVDAPSLEGECYLTSDRDWLWYLDRDVRFHCDCGAWGSWQHYDECGEAR